VAKEELAHQGNNQTIIMKDPYKAEEAMSMILMALFGAAVIGLLAILVKNINNYLQLP
jgi:hypothetical protein